MKTKFIQKQNISRGVNSILKEQSFQKREYLQEMFFCY